MYLCVRGHVFVCQRSCICVLEVMYLCVRGHVFVCQRYRFCLFLRFFSIRCQNCSDSVVVFVFLLDVRTVQTVWQFLFFYQILELFRQCGSFCFSIRFQNCSDSVVFCVFLDILEITLCRIQGFLHIVVFITATQRKTHN